MNSSLIGKIEKARRYAQERDRIRFSQLTATFHGENGEHTVSLDGESWQCNCQFFDGWHFCSHTMAMEKVLEQMLPVGARNQGAGVVAAEV